MSKSQRGIARCPRCDRTVSTDQRRYTKHSTVRDGDNTCRMSGQRIPISGFTEGDFEARAYLVADLASQLQDLDPALVWEYLTALPADELQRLMMVALAGIHVEGKIRDIFRWVCDLPTAKALPAQENTA